MPRPNNKPKPIDARKLLSARPLTSTNFGNLSEIDVYVEATDKWETVATINSAGGIDAEDIAEFIVSLVNEFQETRFDIEVNHNNKLKKEVEVLK